MTKFQENIVDLQIRSMNIIADSILASIYINKPEQLKYAPFLNPTKKSDDNILLIKKQRPMINVVVVEIGGQSVTLAPEIAKKLKAADDAYYAAHKKHIQVNSSFRTFEDQTRIYNRAMARKARGETEGIVAAVPGTSRHEHGLAFDVQNYGEAAPYLREQGFDNRIANDEVHFQLEKPKAIRNNEMIATSGFVQGST